MSTNVRYINGYRLIYLPNHPSAMTSDNWSGWIYEHRAVAEKFMGRSLRNTEEVHHLDSDRSNNCEENLLVLEKSQHAKLHRWLISSALAGKLAGCNGVNSGKSKSISLMCEICERLLAGKQTQFCSKSCAGLAEERRKVCRPALQDLIKDLGSMSWRAVGRKYGVSDNAVRKWIKMYGIDKTTLSQASSTLEEGAETTGEVKSS